MRIGIILHPYGESAPAGLARIIFDLANALIGAASPHEFVLFLKDEPRVRPVFPGNRWRIEILGGGRLWLELGLRRAPRCDAYIFNTPLIPITWHPSRTIVLALDFAYRTFHAKSLRGYITSRLLYAFHSSGIRRADAVIAISNATRNEVLRIHGANSDRVHMVYPGFRNVCQESGANADDVRIPENFFLSVGVVKERKNLEGTVRAFADIAHEPKCKDLKLVVAGKSEGAYAERVRRLANELCLTDRVVWLGAVSDDMLASLYRRAAALVFPSFLEGFGFPIIEAYACGVPVITSSVSSLAEVAGDAAFLADPREPADIARAMRAALDRSARVEYIRRGVERAAAFDWGASARSVFQIIEDVSKKT